MSDSTSDKPTPSSQRIDEEEPLVSVPEGFHATVVRAGRSQAAKGLDINASIMLEELDREVFATETETSHIPTEELSRDGKRVLINEAGEIKEEGPQANNAAWDIQRVLGRGGMGVVCAARQESLRRDVALKIARKGSGSSAGTTRADLEMFTNEAYVTANLDHPNVVPVHTLGKDAKGRLFFTMKQVSGLCWEHILSPALVRNRAERKKVEDRAAKMSLIDHLEILIKVCNALAYAHSKGVIHRDIKPENVMIGSYGEVLLMDWGLAMAFGERNPYVLDPDLPPHLVGTPAFLAPEMARGKMTTFGPQTDVYLLGGTLYRVLTGRAPHWGEGIMGAVNKAASGLVDPPEQATPDAGIDAEISRITMRALEAKIENRYQTVLKFQEDLHEYLSHAEALAISANADEMLKELTEQIVAGGTPDEPQIRPIDKDTAAIAYGRLSECIGAYRQSISLWYNNDKALTGLERALVLQVVLAMEQGDLTLAKAHIEMMTAVCVKGVADNWTGEVRASQVSLSVQLGRRMKRQSKLERREHIQRKLVFAIIIILLFSVGGAFYLITQQKTLALDHLRTKENQTQLASDALRTSENLQKKIFARAVAGRASLVSRYLQEIEHTVSLYQQEAVELMTLPAYLLPPRLKTPAGRDGYYLDEDYYSEQTRPTDLKRNDRLGQLMSASHPTVKLSPWAQAGVARDKALDATARLARLGKLFSRLHRARGDVLWSVIGSKAGALISFPGSGRFREKPEYDPTKRPWYLGAIESTEVRPHWVEPHVDAGGTGLLLSCVSPIRVGDENVGVVGIEIGLDNLQRLMVEFTKMAGSGARGLLVRPDGRIVVDTAYAADPKKWQERFETGRVEDLGEEIASYHKGVRAEQIRNDEAMEIKTADGLKLFSHARLVDPDWTLLVIVDRGEVL